MATAPQRLTEAEFQALYSYQKPYYEYWFGQAIQKSMPTWIHGFLQHILMNLLSAAGYEPASEVRLNIDPDFHPVPDILATKGQIQLPYPTKAVEIVIEILSEDDSMSRLLSKCRAYQAWGFVEIYVVDPVSRSVLRWSSHRLEEVDLIANQPVSQVWTALDRALAKLNASPADQA